MAKTPTISVIMTIYNSADFVEQAIDSILMQTAVDFEIVIVDDGSTDDTPRILRNAETDPRVRVITVSRMGRGKALNTAWRNTSGVYVANLDADDTSEPDRLEKQASFLQDHPEVGLLGTACKIIDSTSNDIQVVTHPLGSSELKKALLHYNPFVHSSVMMPRQVLETVGGYSETTPVAIDYELWVRIACDYELANLPDVLSTKRKSGAAFFQNTIPPWKKHKAHTQIRWHAWRKLPSSLTDLYHVIDPAGRWLITWTSDSLQKKSSG